jgi:hypothetical protein
LIRGKVFAFPDTSDRGRFAHPSPSPSDDYILDEGKPFCYSLVMVEINITVSSVYVIPAVHFSPSISAIVRFSGQMPVSALASSAMDSLLSLEAF